MNFIHSAVFSEEINPQSFAATLFDLNQNKKDSDLLLTIGHEGSHAQDNLDYQGALMTAASTPGATAEVEAAATAVLNGALHVTHGASGNSRIWRVISVR